jgi:hypothetical protein
MAFRTDNFVLLEPAVADALAQVVQSIRTPARAAWEQASDDWWQAVLSDPRVRARSTRFQQLVMLHEYRPATFAIECADCGIGRRTFQTADIMATYGDRPMLALRPTLLCCRRSLCKARYC